jgi:RNA polymerase sigma-70 factor (ECF subfamily)
MNLDYLYIKYFQDVYAYVFSLTRDKYLTEDIVQETFTRAYINIHDIQNVYIKAWLFTVARNIFYDHLRKKQMTPLTNHDLSYLTDNKESPEDKFLNNDSKESIRKKIDSLKNSYRKAIIYYHLEDLSYKESAEKMNITVSNFKSILFRARRQLKQRINSKE